MARLSDRELGMDRGISRRDFLNGAAVTAAGAGAARNVSAAEHFDAAAYPPLRAGLRGEYPEALDELDRVRQGAYTAFPVPGQEIREEYDLVVVGAGISGLAAAYFWRTALGGDPSVLILDNHDDFGGHAKRNEFRYQEKTYIGFGGTMGIATPYPYSYTARQLVKDLGIEVERNAEFANRDLESKYGLGAGMFFDKEHFLEDKLVRGNPRRRAFLEQAPLPEGARNDLIRIHGRNPDYMAGLTVEQKRSTLASISYLDYLLRYAKIDPAAAAFFMGNGGRNHKRPDTTPALEAASHGAAGFNGLGIRFEEAWNEGSYLFHFPDGNASLARLLVARLIPEFAPGPQSMNTIVQAPVHYDRLDVPGAPTRIRLKSPVVRVQPEGAAAGAVKVAYRNGGASYAVRARNCILACFNSLIPDLMPEIPPAQKEALAYPVKVPMLYTNVLIRNWLAFQKLGVARLTCPGMYYPSLFLDPGSTVGGYGGVGAPDQPILVHLVRSPNKPGLPRREQHRAGREELLSMSFDAFERKTREQLARVLEPGGFDVARDILAITVNRWPDGYAYTYDTLADPDMPPEQRPHVLARRRVGRVAIANSDAGAAAFTNQAIDEAHRAVQELLVANGLT